MGQQMALPQSSGTASAHPTRRVPAVPCFQGPFHQPPPQAQPCARASYTAPVVIGAAHMGSGSNVLCVRVTRADYDCSASDCPDCCTAMAAVPRLAIRIKG